MSFSPEESVSLEMNLPSADGKSTEKLGPITYNLYKEMLV
ncbi:type VI secretion protein [Escherichia coli]|nr:type VI secretion protein [Escherichia coli]HCS5668334.1 type VI secretion protein [Escherichia coli]